MDNSKYFLMRTNGNLIVSNKIIKNNNVNNNKKENKIDLNLKLTMNEDIKSKEKEKEINTKNKKEIKKHKTINVNYRIKRKFKCNFITLLRNICLTIIIVSAIGFYLVVFLG